MPLHVGGLRVGLDEPEECLRRRAARRLRVPVSAIRCFAPVRRSLDARDKNNIHFVYQVELALEDAMTERACLRRYTPRHVRIIRPTPGRPPEFGDRPLDHRPVIVGFGPAGMFAALRLVEHGYAPIVLERGREVRRRHYDVLQRFYRERDLDPESNLLFGEGGAGTYSDGKLYTRVADPLVEEVLRLFFQHGGDPAILHDARPHIGSDRLPAITHHIRDYVCRQGGAVRFEQRLEDIEITDGRLSAVRVNDTRRPVGPVILAIGHSARDTLRMLWARGVAVGAKPYQIGVRIEHPQALVDRWQYGVAAGHAKLPPAEYHLVARRVTGAGGDLFSFCMCPGGMILPTVETPGSLATNGASKSRRDGPFANSGLVVTVSPAQGRSSGAAALAALAELEKWEHGAFEATGGTYRLPAQRASDFLAERRSDGSLPTSCPLGAAWCELRALLPPEVAAAVRRGLGKLATRLPGFAGGEAIITAPETRVSAPLRILRDRASRMSVNVDGLYPVGEGAGYAGGIISAAIDGMRSADALMRVYAPPN